MPAPSPSPLHFRGARLLFIAASLVVVVAGLKAAQSFFLPLLMALFLTVLCVPPMRWLERRGLPIGLAALLVIAGAILAVLAVAVVIGGSLQSFYVELPFYRARLDGMVQTALSWLNGHGIDVSAQELTADINTGAVMDLAGSIASSLVAAFSNVVLVLLLMAFMLLELHGAPRKIRLARGDPKADISDIGRGAAMVQRYLAVKTIMGLLNAAIAIGVCFAFGIDFALLWGLFAFLFNFVPNVGSVLAGIPPVLLGLIQYGPARAAMVAALYILLDFTTSNWLEPRMMGRRLGLSPLVVMLSLVFWGWLWGPVGMLLSVPLTSATKLFCEHSEDMRWLAVLLGTGDEPPAKR
jgi:predicted PurR-regulated permease PerM